MVKAVRQFNALRQPVHQKKSLGWTVGDTLVTTFQYLNQSNTQKKNF